MGVRRAHDRAVERAGDVDVGDETAAAEQEAAILDAAQRRADALVVGTVGTIHETSSAGSQSASCWGASQHLLRCVSKRGGAISARHRKSAVADLRTSSADLG